MTTKHYLFNPAIKGLPVPDPWNSDVGFTIEGEPIENSQLYSMVAAVFRAAQLTANAVSNLPFALVRGETDYDTSDKWQNRVGFMPKPKELLRLWRLSLFMTNQAYAFMDSAFTKNLRYIVPHSVTVEKDPAFGITGFARTAGERKVYPLLQISQDRRTAKPVDCPIFWMFRMDYDTEILPSANTEFQALMNSAGVLYYSDYFIRKFLERGGIRPFIASVSGVPRPEEREKLENSVSRLVSNAYKYFVRVFNAEHVSVAQIGDGIDQFTKSPIYTQCIQNVAMASGMPLSLLLANSANYATAQAEYTSWYRDSIVPWANFMADEMTTKLFEPMGLRFEFRPEMSDPDQEGEVQRASAYKTYVDAGMLPSIAAQVVGIDLPPGVEYEDLDPEEEEPNPTPPQLMPFTGQQPVEETEEPEEPEEPEETQPEEKFIPTFDQFNELALWRSFAMRKSKRGEPLTFEFKADLVPVDIVERIKKSLTTAVNEDDIRAAFDVLNVVTTPRPVENPDNEIVMLAAAINKLAEAQNAQRDEPKSIGQDNAQTAA